MCKFGAPFKKFQALPGIILYGFLALLLGLNLSKSITPVFALDLSIQKKVYNDASSQDISPNKNITAFSDNKDSTTQTAVTDPLLTADYKTIRGLYSVQVFDFSATMASQHLILHPESPYRYVLLALLSSIQPNNQVARQFLTKRLNAEQIDPGALQESDIINLSQACANMGIYACAAAEYLQGFKQYNSSSSNNIAITDWQNFGWNLAEKSFENNAWSAAQSILPTIQYKALGTEEKTIYNFMRLRLDVELGAYAYNAESLMDKLVKQPNFDETWRVDFALSILKKAKNPIQQKKLWEMAIYIAKKPENLRKIELARADLIFLAAMAENEGKMIDKSDLSLAITAYTKAIDVSSANPPDSLVIKRAWLYQQSGDKALQAQGSKDLKRLTHGSSEESRTQAYLMLADQSSQALDYAGANLLLQKALKQVKEPKNQVELRFQKLRNDFLSKECKSLHAEYGLTHWVDYQDKAPEAYFWDAECYFSEKNYTQAVNSYSRIPLNNSLPYHNHYYLSLLYAGKEKEAENFKNSLTSEPQQQQEMDLLELKWLNQQNLFQRADQLYSTNEPKVQSPTSKILWWKEGINTYQHLRKFAEVDKLYSKIIKIDSGSTLSYLSEWTSYYTHQKRWKEAGTIWQRYVGLTSGDLKESISLKLAEQDFILKNYWPVLDDVAGIMQGPVSRNFSKALNFTVESYIALKRLPQAINWLEKSMGKLSDLAPEKPALLFRLGELYQATKAWPLALETYKNFLKLYPQNNLAPKAQENSKAIIGYLKSLNIKANSP